MKFKLGFALGSFYPLYFRGRNWWLISKYIGLPVNFYRNRARAILRGTIITVLISQHDLKWSIVNWCSCLNITRHETNLCGGYQLYGLCRSFAHSRTHAGDASWVSNVRLLFHSSIEKNRTLQNIPSTIDILANQPFPLACVRYYTCANKVRFHFPSQYDKPIYPPLVPPHTHASCSASVNRWVIKCMTDCPLTTSDWLHLTQPFTVGNNCQIWRKENSSTLTLVICLRMVAQCVVSLNKCCE